jgi:arylsulfatase
VAQVLEELRQSGLDHNTLVLFSSDNGPWFQGSPGRLRGRKGDTFEGGVRVPFLARFPGRIPSGRRLGKFASTLDILPTISALTHTDLPANPVDGVDIWPMLSGTPGQVEHPVFLHFDSWNLQCARLGKWKLHLARYNHPAFTPEPHIGRYNLRLTNPELYDMHLDSDESADVSADHPGIVAGIQARIEQLLPTLPAAVQAAWADTQRRMVHDTTPGGWPVPYQ